MSDRTSRRPSGSSPDIGSSKITELRLVDERLGDADALQHALGELAQLQAALAPDTDLVEQLLDTRAGAPRRTIAEQAREIRQQFLGGEIVVEVRILRQVADAAAAPTVAERAGRGVPRARDVGNTSCISSFSVVVLPAPLGPRNPNTSPGCDFERELVERAIRALPPEADRVVLRQVGGGERAASTGSAPISARCLSS